MCEGPQNARPCRGQRENNRLQSREKKKDGAKKGEGSGLPVERVSSSCKPGKRFQGPYEFCQGRRKLMGRRGQGKNMGLLVGGKNSRFYSRSTKPAGAEKLGHMGEGRKNQWTWTLLNLSLRADGVPGCKGNHLGDSNYYVPQKEEKKKEGDSAVREGGLTEKRYDKGCAPCEARR